jgi:periplasmic protein TonB
MSREWKISIVCALTFHLVMLYGFQITLSRPARSSKDTGIEVTLVAAPAPEAVVESPPTPPAEIPIQPTPQPVVKPVEPSPVEKPEPIVQPPQPVAPTLQPLVIPTGQPVTTPSAISDNFSETGLDQTTVEAQAGQRARVKYRHNPKPAYPVAARRRGQEGLVTLRVKVTDQGRASSVNLKRSSGFPLLDEAALKAVRDWRFDPARVGSLAVESEIEVPVHFELKD